MDRYCRHRCDNKWLFDCVSKMNPNIFSNNFNKYWSISIIFDRQNLQSLQCSHMLLQNFDETWCQLRLIPQQWFYTVCQKTGCLHYCNKIFFKIMKCWTIQHENVNRGHAATIIAINVQNDIPFHRHRHSSVACCFPKIIPISNYFLLQICDMQSDKKYTFICVLK